MRNINPYKIHIAKYSTHQVIINLIGKNNLVLDVGCNTGYLGALADQSNTFYGIDYLDRTIKKAKTIYKDAVVYDLNNISPLPWNKKYDVIIFGDVLEHVYDPGTVLKYFVDNYLRVNGAIILSLPNVANWQIRLKLLLGKFEYTETGILDKTHLHLYTFKTAEKIVEEAGLVIDEELAGTTVFGFIVRFFPFLRGLLAHGIIIKAKKGLNRYSPVAQ